MASERVRIYEIAKKLGLSNKEVMTALSKNLGMEVKSHSSTISQEDADKLTDVLNKRARKPSDVKKQEKPEQPKIETKQEPKLESKEKPKLESQQKPRIESKPAQQPQGGRPQRPGERPYQGERPQRPAQQPQGGRPQRPGERPYQGERPQRPAQQPQGGRPQRPGERPYQGERPQRPGERPYQKDKPFRPGQKFGSSTQPFTDRKQESFQKPTAPPPPGKKDEQQRMVPRKEAPLKKKEQYKNKEELELEKIEEQKLQSKLTEKKKTKAEEERAAAEAKSREVIIDAPLTVGELAEKLGESLAAVIKQLMMSGVMATVNQTIDEETAKKTAEVLEYTVIKPSEEKKEEGGKISYKEDDESKLVGRAPVVTIMGHVDHGKTTLLDAIRKTKHKIVSTEAGGITQSIGAYTAEINNKKIVFIDTPGHSAFTAMRARGAKATDIVIIVVAADDGIMPQTIEAINHAKAAKVPIIIAVNKIDKDNADPDRALQQLTEHELVPEKWGGDTITVELSALQGINLDELLEYILLVAEIEELKANPDRPASGVVIESKLDKGKGAVATLLVQTGTLKVCDYIVSGTVGGRIRALIDDHGERIQEAGPSTPVEILGLSEIPDAGEVFEVVDSDKTMKEITSRRKDEARMTKLESLAPGHTKRDSLVQKVKGETKELNIIIKATTHGSAEAVSSALQQLESKQIFVKIVHLAVGDISEADVMLASASEAIIIGFGVKEDPNALRVAADEGVVIRKYDIIYKMLEDVEQTMLGLLEPEYKEVEIGTAEVRQIFTVGKNVKIAGCYVLEGKIIRNKQAKVIRDGKEIFKGTLSQLKRFKDDVKEVATGYECGISFDKFNDIEEGDLIKVLTKEEIKRHTLV